jgi:transposase
MRIRITLNRALRQSMMMRLQQAYRSGAIRLIKRIHVLFALIDEGKAVKEVAEFFTLGEQTVRDYFNEFCRRGVASLSYTRPPGRPAKLTKSQRKELKELIEAGAEAAGYSSACWSAVMIQDLILVRFEVTYHPHYICMLLDQMGFSFQKARFVSDHLDEAARLHWRGKLWPQIRQLAKTKNALILFGDEASFAQWGSLSYTWAPKGQQPTVKTSGKRKAYKVFGLIALGTGQLFWKAHTGRFNSDSYAAFLTEVLDQTHQHLILIQDGARYHTSTAMQLFFAQQATRLSVFQLPAYSPDFNPIEKFWKNVKKEASHLKYFPTFDKLVSAVDQTLLTFSQLPSAILSVMASYCEALGAPA